jgi:hypothetical protein
MMMRVMARQTRGKVMVVDDVLELIFGRISLIMVMDLVVTKERNNLIA